MKDDAAGEHLLAYVIGLFEKRLNRKRFAILQAAILKTWHVCNDGDSFCPSARNNLFRCCRALKEEAGSTLGDGRRLLLMTVAKI